MRKTFTGGIDYAPTTLALKKRVTLDPELKYYRPKEVMIPFDQHIGASNQVLVKEGDHVAAGAIIAKTEEDVSGHVHASIEGDVVAIREVPDLQGGTQKAVVIRRNELTGIVEQLSPRLSMKELVREAGVVGLGGATFPTHIKLSPAAHVQVHTVILNGAECEPLIHADDFLMQKEAQKILEGGQIAARILQAKRILVGIEADKPLAVAAMQAAAKKVPNCQIKVLPLRYPQGGEKQLLEALLGAESPLGGRSVETGAFTMNVATSFALAEAVKDHRPLLQRYVTVTGDVARPQVVAFPLGTTAAELLDFAGGVVGKIARVIHGGPMMGRTLHNLGTPLTKGSNGLVVFNQQTDRQFQESPCIRCNKCVVSCPIRLEPQQIEQAYLAGDLYRCMELQAAECINCGCCSYVCPAKRQLAQRITLAKRAVNQAREAVDHG